MSKIDEVMQISKRWSPVSVKPRKDVPRLFADLDDTKLAERLKQVNNLVTLTERVDLKCLDGNPEALRIRAMAEEDRKALRAESLRTATLLRDEFRRRMSYSVKAQPSASASAPETAAPPIDWPLRVSARG
ncbi:MAG TPA: hypothetical protein VM146_00745 [Steroidobacteraceae bacterium]|nr:hypothetical protein [Steroidobacteraceae bacterium]